MIEYISDMIAYQEWADAHFYRMWNQMSAAHEDPEILLRQAHITFVQVAFLKALQGEEVQLPKADTLIPAMVDLQARAHVNHAKLRAFVSQLDPTSLNRQVIIPFFPDPTFRPTVRDALMQIAMHTQHHRGQNLSRLRHLGAERLVIDWIVWIMKQKPEASWPD